MNKGRGKEYLFIPAYRQQNGYTKDRDQEFLNKWNDLQVEKQKAFTLEQVKEQFRCNREELIKRYESIWSDNKLIISNDLALHLVDDLLQHDEEHYKVFKLI